MYRKETKNCINVRYCDSIRKNMYLEKPVVSGGVVGTYYCSLCCCLLTRHNQIDFHFVTRVTSSTW